MAHYLQPYLSVLNPKSAILQSAGEVCLAKQHMFLMSPQSLHGESFVETLKVVLRTSITIRSLKLVNRFLAINIPGVKCNLHAKYQLCEFSNLVAHWDQRKPASHSDLSKYTVYLILEYNIIYIINRKLGQSCTALFRVLPANRHWVCSSSLIFPAFSDTSDESDSLAIKGRS